MKVSLVSGLCVVNDAISNVVYDEYAWFTEDARNDLKLYCNQCDYGDVRNMEVRGLKDILFDRHFQESELIIFHFGVYYEIFDAIIATPSTAKKLVIFHNLTPKKILPEKEFETSDKSFRKLYNIQFADHVYCDSITNLDVLRQHGVSTPATIMPLALHGKLKAPEKKPSTKDNIIRLLYIGRFVTTKGPHELLRALDGILAQGTPVNIKLDLVGNLVLSDATLYDEICRLVSELNEKYSNKIAVTCHDNASDELKGRLLTEADIFILPTYHEGFCMPILEALASACRVVVYENSNTPAISNGFADLVPTGDVSALSHTIYDVITEVASEEWLARGYIQYALSVTSYAASFSPDRTRRRFMRGVREILQERSQRAV